MAVYKLGDVCSYIEGYTNPSINNKDFFGGNKINWMRVKDLKNGSSINKTELTLSNEGFNLIKNKNQIFKKGTIVWSKSGTVGNVGLLNINVCANRGILNILPKEKIHKKYLYYFLLKNKNKFQNLSTGAVLKHFYGPNLMNFKINLPSIKIQKQIIDIIEPYEKLFLNYSQCVRIDNIKNTKNDLKNLIDIIEPLEKLINKCKLIKNKMKILLINQYLQKENKYVNLSEIIFKKIQKRFKQNFYFQTNGILELNIDFSKIINLNKSSKIPSRANLVPQDNSILFSKLLGENKILPWFNELKNQYVFSTGFYNVQSKNLDHVLSFLLTKEFKEQKIIFANGTTMVGINDNSIKNIKIKKPNENSNVFSKFIFKLIFLENKINLIKNKVLNLLIK